MNRIEEAVNYKPLANGYSVGEPVHYETNFYCKEDNIIHSNVKSYTKCNKCFSDLDRSIYEAQQRMKWFLEGYFKHNLGKSFSNISTEDICKNYNVEIKYFRPWSK